MLFLFLERADVGFGGWFEGQPNPSNPLLISVTPQHLSILCNVKGGKLTTLFSSSLTEINKEFSSLLYSQLSICLISFTFIPSHILLVFKGERKKFPELNHFCCCSVIFFYKSPMSTLEFIIVDCSVFSFF